MTIILTTELMTKIYPQGNKDVIKAFVNKQALMNEILQTPERAALCFANMSAETSGFALAGLTENIRYSASRMAKVWPHRFPGGEAAVQQRYGTGPNWQLKAIDDIYGSRLGNRPGTSDGSTFIGRGGPQLTGRDEYSQISDAIGVDLLGHPDLATKPDLQPDIIAAYWKQKGLSRFCDGNSVDIVGARHRWNGGENGLDVVRTEFKRMLPLLKDHAPVSAAANVQLPNPKIDPVLRQFQEELIDIGYHEIGEADGMLGGKTLGAIKAFFTDRGIDARAEYPSDVLTNELYKVHQMEWKRPIAPGRAFATEETLAPKIASVKPTQNAGFIAKIGAWFSGLTATGKLAVSFMPDLNEQATPYVDLAKQWFNDIPGWVFPAMIAGIAIAIAYQTTKAKKATVDDYQTGKIN